ncbi:hypothetical protein [Litoreibacter halocynthiae]|uniref:hypothetical protein n=1 Tax=Litoreibacter halocynthiae TaxID=1242689 RepID=UPI002491E6BB|nr:hypothetical protein [Litoreibacter halocynthiae]
MTWFTNNYSDESQRFGSPFGHWSFCEDENYFDDLANVPRDAAVLSLRPTDCNWDALASLDALEEVTAAGLTKPQLKCLLGVKTLKRLRLWNMRQVDFTGIRQLDRLEELALFNVSGPKSLVDIAALPALRSLLIENMRSLDDWSALSAARGLQCLCISGGFVEVRPKVSSLAFLGDLDALRHLHVGYVNCTAAWPVFEGLARCAAIESVHVNSSSFSVDDMAYLDAIIPEEKQLEKRRHFVGGEDRQIATTLEAAKQLSGDRLEWEPRVKWQKDQPYTRRGPGKRDDVFAKLAAFEDRLHTVRDRVKQALAAGQSVREI